MLHKKITVYVDTKNHHTCKHLLHVFYYPLFFVILQFGPKVSSLLPVACNRLFLNSFVRDCSS